MKKMVISCAITGAETTREQHPALPLTPEEIADATCEAHRAGAAIVHLHVRDERGLPTQRLDVFKKTIDLIHRKCDIVIEITTGGAAGMGAEERLLPVSLEPEMASLDCGTVNFGEDCLINTLPMLREFAQVIRGYNVRPILECFDLSHIYASHILIKEGLIEPPYHYGFVFNAPGGVRLESDVLDLFVRKLPAESLFTVLGIGSACLPAHFGAIHHGGFIRVGFEDNVYYSKGVPARNNAELVERAVRIAGEAGMECAKPDEVRKIMRLRN